MWWFTTRKSGVNAVNHKELLGLDSYGTAWPWLQKLRRCTIRQDREKLSGRVEVDEFFIGGQRSGKRRIKVKGRLVPSFLFSLTEFETMRQCKIMEKQSLLAINHCNSHGDQLQLK